MEARAPPSKVLFIRDIPPSISNEQFENLFQTLPGFVSIRRKPFFAFVEFKDSGYATSAMRRHNGYRHHPADKPLVIDFDKDPRSRDDFSSSTTSSSSTSSNYPSASSSTSSSYYRDLDRDRDRDLDSVRRGESRGSASESSSHRDAYSKESSRGISDMERDDKDLEESRFHDRDDDLDDTDRSDKHRPKREAEILQTHSSLDIDKKRPRDFDRFEKDRGRYRDLDEYPMKRGGGGGGEFHSMHHTPPYGETTGMPYFLPTRPSYDLKDACSTLFVSNLPKDVTERELSILFRFMRGFINVRLVQREGKYPICFCDFRDTLSAAGAMEMLNGFKMDTKDISSSISIEFDKSRTHRP
ncbi:RNA-binding region RNP-1 domain-containing protein [Heterostelium album PN500]|uniref:RNA-binding region RNP-1 domain-containing protein n=1 Tax=Heterostelium pallidum (strain ATCC 26659 / Pp 5 / PN500) TaxID=670386 RepID=D3AYT0_HETP5|nr:RNA-binding region RNP-1 domain-containing protein [Heterostelium album PN500]EFA85620.1 RNA-binding region RNP-1 domain-containing protein [Heterostelium album PN500]|eukprot:XP_020437727.1 RNA-binding region RNP-1 domain-containing protein [Heterostelium album PN500]